MRGSRTAARLLSAFITVLSGALIGATAFATVRLISASAAAVTALYTLYFTRSLALACTVVLSASVAFAALAAGLVILFAPRAAGGGVIAVMGFLNGEAPRPAGLGVRGEG